ncbi:MAG: response regulator transcription factor [Bacteroidota bacterium]
MSKTTFIIFEKCFLVRHGLISLLKEIQGAELFGDFNSAYNFASLIKTQNPDIIIINQELYRNINTQTIKNLSAEYNFKLIGITDKKMENTDSPFSELIYYKEEKVEILKKINNIVFHISGNKKKIKDNNEISEREKAVLECVAKGMTNKEIAEKLFISAHTVITHRKNIVRKLGIKTVSGLTVYAILNKIIDMTDLK